MRERKYVKFKVDMYEDTKFKIIDRMEKRDLINYVWTRLLLLAGKVNLEGELFLSRNIPYTLETLAIELNREISEIELSIKIFIDLEMVEFREDKVYKVKNFAKHQNIKRSEKVQNKDNIEESYNNKEKDKIIGKPIIKDSNKNVNEEIAKLLKNSSNISKNIAAEINPKEELSRNYRDKIYEYSDSEHKDNKVTDINEDSINSKNINDCDNNHNIETRGNSSESSYNIKTSAVCDNNVINTRLNLNTEKDKNKDDTQVNILTPLDSKKIKNKSRKKEINNDISVIGENEEGEVIELSEGEPQIGKDEELICAFSF